MAHADLVSFRFVCLKFSVSSAAEPGLIWESGRSTFSDTDLQGEQGDTCIWTCVLENGVYKFMHQNYKGGAVYPVL